MPFVRLHVFVVIQSCDHIGKNLAEAYIPPIFMFTCSRALVRLINTDLLFHSFNYRSEKVGDAIFVHIRNPLILILWHCVSLSDQELGFSFCAFISTLALRTVCADLVIPNLAYSCLDGFAIIT